MKTATVKLDELTQTWPKVREIMSVPHTKRQYDKMVSYLNLLIDKVGEDPRHPLASLLETIGTLIEVYEERSVPEPTGDPVSVLKMLMEEHGLKQNDMKDIGSQGVISEVLNGKRKLNARQIQALAEKFNVSPAVFL